MTNDQNKALAAAASEAIRAVLKYPGAPTWDREATLRIGLAALELMEFSDVLQEQGGN
jgi:hypothetical protein